VLQSVSHNIDLKAQDRDAHQCQQDERTLFQG
jgi:hypothetical protein